jgi:outer membrane protein TolC
MLSLLLSLLLSAAVRPSFAAPQPTLWTARMAVSSVRQNSPDSELVKQRLEGARAAQREAAAAFYPRLDLEAGYSQTDNPMYSFGNILNQGRFSQEIDFNDPGRSDNLGFELGANYRIYNGGRDLAARDAATAEVAQSSAAGEALLQQLEFEAYRAYRRIVEAERVIAARQAALASAEAALMVARARFDAGELLKIDLLNLQVQQAGAEEALLRARHQRALAGASLLALLGLPDAEVAIADETNDLPAVPAKTGIEGRPELRRLAARLSAAEARLAIARAGRLPTVDGFASYRHDQALMHDGRGDSWLAGARLKLNLFDGHRVSAETARAAAEVAQLKAERRKLERSLQLELKRAGLALELARQSKLVAVRRVQRAAESARLSQARYRAGVILTAELIDNDNRLVEARVDATLAESALAIAIADLRRAAGLAIFDRNESTMESQP